MTNLRGNGILITGGSLGIGRAIAAACVEAGADVFLCARGAAQLEETAADLRRGAAAGQRVEQAVADVADPEAVDSMIAAVRSRLGNFSGVVNCAGINGPKGLLEETPVAEWIATVQSNLIGTMLVCRAAIPHLRAKKWGRIVNLSGGGATASRPRFTAYAAAKTAVVRLTETLAEELAGSGVSVNSIAPGAVNTRLLSDILEAGPERIGEAVYKQALKQQAEGGTPPEKAAELCVFLLSEKSDGVSGRLISAVWDPWQSLAARQAELAKTDVYKLRRIVPEDRNLKWE